MGIDKKNKSAPEGSEGWTEWHGGECPVDSDAIVEVRYRKPNPYQYNNDRAGDFLWLHTGSGGDIMAYRLHRNINSRANDDLLEQDLNECIGQSMIAEKSEPEFPEAGAEIEYSTCGQDVWYRGIVTAIGESMYIVKNLSGAEQAFHKFDIEFRPLRTEADKKRDEAIKGMASVIDYRNGCSSKPLAGWIYEAIAAGKIPGVKLEGK